MNLRRLVGVWVAVSALAVLIGFFAPWAGSASGFDLARGGGRSWVLLLIPVGAAAACWAGYRASEKMALAALATVGAVVLPLVITAIWESGWRVQLYLATGALLLVAGAKRTARELALPIGLALLALYAYIAIRVGWQPGSLSSSSMTWLGIYDSYTGRIFHILLKGLAVLLYASPLSALWMTVAGMRQAGERLPMLLTGGLMIGVFLYILMIVGYAAANFGGAGLLMVGLGTLGLLLATFAVPSTSPAPPRSHDKAAGAGRRPA